MKNPVRHLDFVANGKSTENAIVKKVLEYNPESDVAAIRYAYQFAKKAHLGQKRSSGEDYFVHPVAVAEYIINLGLDDASIITALLHDTIEDTDVTEDDIRREFGNKVADLVCGLTKLTKIKFQPENVQQAENFRKLLLAMSKDARVIIIKLHDRLHNMQTLEHLPMHKQRRVALETLEIFAPLAERIGMYWLKDQLQDLAFKSINAGARISIVKQIKVLKAKYSKALERALATTDSLNIITAIENALTETINGFDIECSVLGREKTPYSLWKKISEKKLAINQVADVIAFRVIVLSIEDCYCALGAIHRTYKAIPGALKDYISTPKLNGYRCIHTVIMGPFGHRVEIQIRTKEMDFEANNGLASHWGYKQKIIPHHMSQQEKIMQWIGKVLEIVKETNNPFELMEAAKLEVSQDIIFIFTPKGELISLPVSSTVLDFAFAIHTDIGIRCLYGIVNGQDRPNNYVLQNGDLVEIIKSKKPIVTLVWLEDCVSNKARLEIDKLTRCERIEKTRLEGAAIMRSVLESFGKELTKKAVEEVLDMASKKYRINIAHHDDLYIKIAKSIIDPLAVVESLYGINSHAINQEAKEMQDQRSMISGASKNLIINFAKCCKSQYGDQIVGIVTNCSPVLVHNKECPNLDMIVNDGNEVPLGWKRLASL